ncbi:hypothetical protein U1Q18_002282, partial [Sarracenia purpurea var. burkii]
NQSSPKSTSASTEQEPTEGEPRQRKNKAGKGGQAPINDSTAESESRRIMESANQPEVVRERKSIKEGRTSWEEFTEENIDSYGNYYGKLTEDIFKDKEFSKLQREGFERGRNLASKENSKIDSGALLAQDARNNVAHDYPGPASLKRPNPTLLTQRLDPIKAANSFNPEQNRRDEQTKIEPRAPKWKRRAREHKETQELNHSKGDERKRND